MAGSSSPPMSTTFPSKDHSAIFIWAQLYQSSTAYYGPGLTWMQNGWNHSINSRRRVARRAEIRFYFIILLISLFPYRSRQLCAGELCLEYFAHPH